MATHFEDEVDVSTMPVNTGVSALPGEVQVPESGSFAAMVLRSGAVDWSVVDYKSKYEDCFDIRKLNSMLSDGWNEIMYDRRCVKSDINIGGWNRCWQIMKSYCPGYVNLIGPMDMPMK